MQNGLLPGFLLFLSIQFTTAQTLVSGWVKDVQTQEPLAFATVGIEGTSIGTLSNGSGFFELRIQESASGKPIAISFLGYEHVRINSEAFGENLQVNMKVKVIRLADVVVRPLRPEDYIKKAVKNIDQTLGKSSYGAIAYYREKFLENGAYLAFSEGVFKAFYPPAGDTIPKQYQLLLYETAENPAELQFMKEYTEKKEAKKQRKAERKGEEYEEGGGAIQASFGGPDDIISQDLRNDLEPFLDSTKFKKYRYSFGEPVQYQDRELVSILFESKGTVEHMRSSGKIYIDLKSNAFASVEFEGDIVIPFVVDPILFALGISIKNPYVEKHLRYQLVDGAWYPEYFYIHIDVDLEKRHMFDPNEKSKFEIEQVLKFNEIMKDATQIPVEKRFKKDQKPEDQIHNDTNLNWSDISTIKDENNQTKAEPNQYKL